MEYSIKELLNDEREYPLEIFGGSSFTQSNIYANWQTKKGRWVGRYLVEKNNKTIAFFQVIEYPLFFGKKCLYIPYGPVSIDTSRDFFVFLKNSLLKISKERDAIFARIDFDPKIESDLLNNIFTKSPACTYSSSFFQPRSEWVLDISKSEEEILLQMEKDTRYSVKTSQKRGAVGSIITEDFGKYFDDFYNLLETTAKRNGFGIHDKKYYKNIFESLRKENAFLSIVSGENILVIDVFIIFGKTVHYVFGSSSNEERNKLPSYMAIWNAILYVKEKGIENINFGGYSAEAKKEKWSGFSIFKKGWGGEELKHSDFFDIVSNRFWYYLYSFIKKIKTYI